MTYCKKCGAELAEGTFFCPSCGAEVNPQTPAQTYQTYTAPQQPVSANDSGNIGWGVLGFCFPIVGLILFLIWRNNKPKTAKIAIIGAGVSVLISILLSFGSGLFATSMY